MPKFYYFVHALWERLMLSPVNSSLKPSVLLINTTLEIDRY